MFRTFDLMDRQLRSRPVVVETIRSVNSGGPSKISAIVAWRQPAGRRGAHPTSRRGPSPRSRRSRPCLAHSGVTIGGYRAGSRRRERPKACAERALGRPADAGDLIDPTPPDTIVRTDRGSCARLQRASRVGDRWDEGHRPRRSRGASPTQAPPSSCAGGHSRDATSAAVGRFVACDVRDPDQVDASWSTTSRRREGRLDVVVNNAGGSPIADTATASPRFSEAIIRLNLLAPLLRRAGGQRRDAGAGRRRRRSSTSPASADSGPHPRARPTAPPRRDCSTSP